MEYERLPEPIDKRVKLHMSKPMYTATVRFGGFANAAEISKHREKLAEVLKELKLQHNNQFEYLGYNAPYEMVNRRNEVQVELVDFKPELLSKNN
jgi:hypothetical protein